MNDRTPNQPRRARQGGVVMVITLFAIILIASLLFYVYNVGTSVQGRVVTQHAADATAIGGASQVARAMNAVAMNNTETARLIAAVSMLDGVPMAVDFSVTDETETELGDVDALGRGVTDQVQRGIVDNWLDRKLREMISSSNPDSVYAERDYLLALDSLFRTQPDLIPEMTWYQAPSGEMGRMHQAMRSMDAHSQAAMETISQTAQSAASRSAVANLGATGSDGGLLLPAMPTIPWQRGKFVDYERPAKYGLLPGRDRRLSLDNTSTGFGQIDDELINRGPWDALFGWRYTNRISADPGTVPSSPSQPPRMSTPTTGRDPDEYRVFGPETMIVSQFPWRRYSMLRSHLWELHSYKSNYLWSDSSERVLPDSAWEIDIRHDNERSDDRNDEHVYGMDTSKIRQTMFVIVEIKSRVEGEEGMPARQGITWNYVDAPGRQSPYVVRYSGWRDPRDGPPIRVRGVSGPAEWRRVQDYVWRLSSSYLTNPYSPNHGGDPSINLPAKQIGTDNDGNPVYEAQEVFWEVDYVLIGANIGDNVVVTNPWKGFNKYADDAPAPIDLVHEQLPVNNDGARWDYLTFLGVARQSSRPNFWPTRFQGDKPYPYNTAIAQARVLNNHSWDLWTQTWQASLEPVDVDRFNQWVARAQDAVDLAGGADADGFGLNPEQISQIADQLQSVESLAPVMLNH